MRIKHVVAGWLIAVGLAQAADKAVPASELMPLQERSRQFLVTEGDNSGEMVRVGLEPVAGGGNEWLLRMEKVGNVYLTIRDDGAIMVSRIDLEVLDQQISYAQPVLLLPATVTPGEEFDSQTTANIVDTKDGTTREGRVDHRLDPARRTIFQLPLGAVGAYRIEANQTISLDMATVTLRLEGGFARDRGLVYGDIRYTIDKPLFFGSSSQQTVKLAE